ncbi:MAG: lipocalin-like domain-containing protein [Actinomycetota bacterium]
MGGELKVTPEFRKKAAEDNAASLARMGLKPDTVEVWEDGYRTAEEKDAFEWWYFDAQFDNGSTAVVTFSTKPHTKPKGPLAPIVLIMYRSPQGESVRYSPGYAPEELAASSEGCDVRIGPSWVKGDLASYELHAEAEDMAVDLALKRQGPSWRPGAAVSYFNSAKTKYLAWVVPVPYGTVEGTITRGGATTAVKGSVYHDHNWGNAVMGNMLDHWFWGRAHVGDFSIIFSQLVTIKVFGLGGIKLPVFFLSKGDRILTDDGLPLRLETADEVDGPMGQTYPRKLDFTWEAEEGRVEMAIRDPKLIEVLDMTEDLSHWRRSLAHIFGNPLYYDFDAELELSVDLAGVKEKTSGRVIFEKMMFH